MSNIFNFLKPVDYFVILLMVVFFLFWFIPSVTNADACILTNAASGAQGPGLISFDTALSNEQGMWNSSNNKNITILKDSYYSIQYWAYDNSYSSYQAFAINGSAPDATLNSYLAFDYVSSANTQIHLYTQRFLYNGTKIAVYKQGSATISKYGSWSPIFSVVELNQSGISSNSGGEMTSAQYMMFITIGFVIAIFISLLTVLHIWEWLAGRKLP